MALLAVIPACGFHSSESKDGGDDDGTPGSPRCFGSFVKICFTALADVPTMPLTITDATTEINTATGISNGTGTPPLMCDQHNEQKDEFCVVAGAGLTIPANKSIRGYGSKPLVLLSTTTMTIEATSTVDVSSNHMASGEQAQGAGGNSPLCTSGAPPELAGGGYGGSFGGKGGDGEQLAGAAATSGVAAAALTLPPMMMLRGGCPGGGGDASGGVGGSGGGAVALIAVTSIQLDGKINASGAGGTGGPASKSGGGGGGSGGMIVLDAPSLMIMLGGTGTLFANGGGGGQGGAAPDGGASKPGAGEDGHEPMAPTPAALGGSFSDKDGGSGGNGSVGSSRLIGLNGGSSPVVHMGGGGAGGGGAGFIRAHGITGDSIISPPSFIP